MGIKTGKVGAGLSFGHCAVRDWETIKDFRADLISELGSCEGCVGKGRAPWSVGWHSTQEVLNSPTGVLGLKRKEWEYNHFENQIGYCHLNRCGSKKQDLKILNPSYWEKMMSLTKIVIINCCLLSIYCVPGTELAALLLIAHPVV